jgi:NAD(P)H-hydrate repair Nnr-like enzyme with NAD(P)H-hydrate dehydratase domain
MVGLGFARSLLEKVLAVGLLAVVHHYTGALVLYSSGAPKSGAPLVDILVVAHLSSSALLLTFYLVHPLTRLTSEIGVAHHASGAPLVSLAIF